MRFLLLLALLLWADEAPAWRFWSAADGMRESYSTAVTRGARGEVLVKHGQVDAMDLLDGFNFRSFPDPRSLSRVHPLGRVYQGSGQDGRGDLYTFDADSVEIYENGRWNR